MFKSGSIPNCDSGQIHLDPAQQQSDLHQHSTLIDKVHLPFSNHPSTMTMPMNTVFHGQLIYDFIQTRHEHQICRSFD